MEEQLETPAETDRREVFYRYQGRLRRFFRSRGFSEDESLDLTQESLFRVFKEMRGVRSRSSLEAWILRVAVNVWKNEIRHRRAVKRDAPEISLDELDPGQAESQLASVSTRKSPSPLDEALASERLLAVKRCLRTLPPGMQRCLLLYADQNRKYQEIADLLHLSIQTVKSHIFQARQRLGDCLARRLAGGGV